MKSPVELYQRAMRLGLRLEPRGDKLAVIPAKLCPPDLAHALSRHKLELLDWLEARGAGIEPDKAAWLHVAKQVLKGEFDGCCNSTRASLNIGLRSILHPICHRAIEKLELKVKQV